MTWREVSTCASAGEAGENGPAGAGGNAGSGAGNVLPELPKFCNEWGWCGAPYPLDAVWGSQANDVWVAANARSTAYSNERSGPALLHYDGQRWTNTPHLALGSSASIRGIWGDGPDSVWFVGSNDGLAVAVRWNGDSWSEVWDISGVSALHAVRGLSRNNLWAVGTGGSVARWQNGSWSKVDAEVKASLRAMWNDGGQFWAVGKGGAVVRGVCALSRSDAWAVAEDGSVLHWDGQAWLPHHTFDRQLTGVWCGASHDVWAIDANQAALHWDGKNWTELAVPSSALADVPTSRVLTGTSQNDVWIFSAFSDGVDEKQRSWFQSNRWTGRWATIDMPGWPPGTLTAATPARNDAFWMVGAAIWYASLDAPPVLSYASESDLGVTLHGVWTPPDPLDCGEPLPDETLRGSELAGAWAVGSAGTLLQKHCVRRLSVPIRN